MQGDESNEPAEQVGFVLKIDTSVEAVKPEEKPKNVRKPHESIQDKKDKPRGKPEKNVPEWAKKGRAKDTAPPVKPKTKPKSTDTRRIPGEAEIAPELTIDVEEPGVELREGDDAQLKVTFKGTPPANVEWFKDGSKLTDKSRFTLKNKGDGCELVVRKVTPRDSGAYICVATNETESSTKTFHLIVALKLHQKYCYCISNGKWHFVLLAPLTPLQPQSSDKVIFKQEMTDLEISDGDDAKFDVRVDGADVEVDWYRDDELLEDAGRIIIEDLILKVTTISTR